MSRTTYLLADLPIFTDDNGKPIPGRPEREPGPTATVSEQIDYARAVDAYRDRAYSRAGRVFALAFTAALAGCFHEPIDVDPIVDGTSSGTSGPSSWSGASESGGTGPASTSGTSGSVSFSGSGSGESTGTAGESTGGTDESTGTAGESTGTTTGATSTVSPCDAQCPTCLDTGQFSACATPAPCGEGFEPTPETDLCYLPCTNDADCFEGTVCVGYNGPHGAFQGCLFPK